MSYNKRQPMQTSHTPHYLRWMLTAFSFFVLCLVPTMASAATLFTATPVVLDGKGKQREIIRYSISVENQTNHLVSIYPWVTDIDTKKGEEGFSDLEGSRDKELSASLARWIEVTRGSVDLLPHEKKEIGVTVQINLNAKPGIYHATIHLSAGSDRASAERDTKETVDVGVNIEVLEDINERLQLDVFLPTKKVFSGDQADFSYSIENIGNRGLIPRGKIRIYDRRGIEVATVDANQDGKKLEPSTNQLLSSAWASGGEFGRYKAMLDLEYGGHGTLQDTVFFWVIPWKKLVGMFTSLMILCVVIAVVLHSRSEAVNARRRLGYEPVSGGGGKGMFGFFGGGDDTEEVEEYKEEVVDSAYERNSAVKEIREVPLPKPVHTRLYSRTVADNSAQVQLHDRAVIDMSSHQVVLGKREEPKVSPRNIINLKR